ncbi:UNVERIFIED_ORG: 5-methylcytosine-specific restriction protein A [Rhodococcus erythropolis]
MAWTNGHTRTSTTKHRQWALTVKRRDHYRCVKCGYQGTPGKADVEADHIRNQAAGGTETLGNGQTLCLPCHTRKTLAEAQQGRQKRTPQPRIHPHPAGC